MKSKRVTRSGKLSSEFKGLLENLHGPSQEDSTTAPEHLTLAEASKQDIDKLLGCAGARGAAARVKGGANSITRQKRGRKNVFPEGEDSLFYQRNARNSSLPSGNTQICEASWINLVNVKCRSSSEQGALPPNSFESAEDKELDTTNVSSHGLSSLNNEALDECTSMEDDCEWELEPAVSAGNDQEHDRRWDGELNIEVDMDTPEISERKAGKRVLRRANAKDKEFAELVHRTHLLCLIARGRLVDAACNDPVLQASLLSLVPEHLHFCDTHHISASELGPFVNWFQSTFQICSDSPYGQISAREDLTSQLLNALHKQAGSNEEVAALSVSLLRALGFTTRYVTVLDVLSIKPDASSLEASIDWDSSNTDEGAFSQWLLGTNLGSSLGQLFSQVAPQSLARAVTNAMSSPSVSSPSQSRKKNLEERKNKQELTRKLSGNGKQKVEDFSGCKSQRAEGCKKLRFEESHESHLHDKEEERDDCTNISTDGFEVHVLETKGKSKGDIEFELQLAMAMAATAVVCKEDEGSKNLEKKVDHVCLKKNRISPASEKVKVKNDNSASVVKNGGAVWSRKLGPLLHWAEVYCGGKDGGRWVHVNAARGLLDGAEVVEEAARSCKVPLRYVLAFAGSGAKDVTCRYVTVWSAVAPLRVSNEWWNVTLAPLKELEAAETSKDLKEEEDTISRKDEMGETGKLSVGSSSKVGSLSRKLQFSDRSSLEDMELDIRACTEPLPKNQQAYKNHHLYVLERWLTKYQALHPRGPILGYCGGHPVFPRTCVQGLHTAERWLWEGLKVKAQELPAKTIKNSRVIAKQSTDDSFDVVGESCNEVHTTALFGKWQTEPWCPPPAIGGIVPKNERGNVELWSEKCLPPGTVHISLPRILPVAKKLEIDFAPALVGFEIRNRRSVPVFEGIVVCQEHEIILLEAYAEEEYWRNAEAEKKRESLAVARWCQLLRSVTTRQRLQATYQISQEGFTFQSSTNDCGQAQTKFLSESENRKATHEDDHIKNQCTPHEHMFPEENQSYDEQTGMCTKICPCGFMLTVEEL